jgi:hypothetical protein
MKLANLVSQVELLCHRAISEQVVAIGSAFSVVLPGLPK